MRPKCKRLYKLLPHTEIVDAKSKTNFNWSLSKNEGKGLGKKCRLHCTFGNCGLLDSKTTITIGNFHSLMINAHQADYNANTISKTRVCFKHKNMRKTTPRSSWRKPTLNLHSLLRRCHRSLTIPSTLNNLLHHPCLFYNLTFAAHNTYGKTNQKTQQGAPNPRVQECSEIRLSLYPGTLRTGTWSISGDLGNRFTW